MIQSNKNVSIRIINHITARLKIIVIWCAIYYVNLKIFLLGAFVESA
jgi:hypothetical protein